MQYTNKVLGVISVINAALQELNKPTVFENADFTIGELNFEDYLTLRLDKKDRKDENKIYYIMNISGDGLEVHLDRIPEAFWCSHEEINKDRAKAKDFILMLLSSTVKADCYGSSYDINYTKVSFYNDKGDCVHTVDRITGLLPIFIVKRLPFKEKMYEPFYILESG